MSGAVSVEIWGIFLLTGSTSRVSVNGFSIGLCQLTLTTYVSELAPVQLRGGLLIVYSFW